MEEDEEKVLKLPCSERRREKEMMPRIAT